MRLNVAAAGRPQALWSWARSRALRVVLPVVAVLAVVGCDGESDAPPSGTTSTGSGGASTGTPTGGGGRGAGVAADVTQWVPQVVETFESAATHRWSDFPLQVDFEHEDGLELTLDGHWTGGSSWAVRFAAPLAGEWTWTASSATSDPGLSGSGSFVVAAPTAAELGANANLHGHVQVAGRYFTYADGTPHLVQGDTAWFFNAALTRDMYGQGDTPNTLFALEGSFYDWLEDRSAKGFNAVLVRWVSGHTVAGDSANEGGYLWDADATPPEVPVADWSEINPSYFESLDTRVQAVWERGLVILGHPTWFGEEENVDVAQAAALSHYLLARYGAFNIVWSISGEFQKELPYWVDNGYASYADLGRWVGGSDDVSPPRAGFNPYGHPMSVHPAAWDPGPPEALNQTSRIFDEEDWLDHHWIQSYSHTDKIVYRVAELRGDLAGGLSSARPVLLSEPCYEQAEQSTCDFRDRDQGATFAEQEASTMRRQPWTALIAGAAGTVYGAHGVWQGTTPAALDLPGSGQVRYARELFETLDWQALAPSGCVEISSGSSWASAEVDYPASNVEDYVYAPRCTMTSGVAYVIYIPGGNQNATLRAAELAGAAYYARWYDPRSGAWNDVVSGPSFNDDGNDREPLPARPSSAPNDDWALVLTTAAP